MFGKRELHDLYLLPDNWSIAENRLQADTSDYRDSSFPGCDYRLQAGRGLYQLACNVKITGKSVFAPNYVGGYKTRVRIELVKDDNEPSEFLGGFIFSDYDLCDIRADQNKTA